jgi:hypothetical protein
MKWVTTKNPDFYFGGIEEIKKYNGALLARKNSGPPISTPPTSLEQVSDIETKGFAILKKAIPPETLDRLREEFDNAVTSGHTKVNDQYYVVVKDPLLHCPTVLEVATSDLIKDTVSGFFGCIPSLGTLNFRKSLVHHKDPVSTQLFHCDQNSVRFLKCFIYLNDVRTSEEGPLTIIPASLDQKPGHWTYKYRWSEDEMTEIYGEGCLTYLCAEAGDLIISRATSGFHRGTPPLTQERTMLTLNYVVHPEEWKPIDFKMHEHEYLELDNSKKPLCDFIKKV